jgi:hypothetical protein
VTGATIGPPGVQPAFLHSGVLALLAQAALTRMWFSRAPADRTRRAVAFQAVPWGGRFRRS